MLGREKLGRPPESHEPARSGPERREAWSMLKRWAAFSGRQSRLTIAIIATLSVFAIGGIDYLSGNEISWSIIYVLPIALATWHVGRTLRDEARDREPDHRGDLQSVAR